MKPQIWLASIWLAAFPAISGALASESYFSRFAVPQRAQPSVDGWARENYTRALDLVLRERCSDDHQSSGHATDPRWLACVRVVPAFKNELEYSASLEKNYNGTLFAQIVRPKGHSIYFQMCEHKKQQPRAGITDLAKLINAEAESGDQSRFPEIIGLADEFERIRVSPILSDELLMDATEYRFRVKSPYGENLVLTLLGPGSTAPHQPPGLIQWAESLKKALAAPR